MVERYEVVITSRAEESLEQIILSLEERASYEIADRVRKGLLESIAKLERHPESNSIVQEISDEKVTYRRVLKWSYRIIYTVEEVVKIVFVLDIDSPRRDPKNLKDSFK